MEIASHIFETLSSIRTTSEASIAASEPIPPIAIPTSHLAITGASFIPSPTNAIFSLVAFIILLLALFPFVAFFILLLALFPFVAFFILISTLFPLVAFLLLFSIIFSTIFTLSSGISSE